MNTTTFLLTLPTLILPPTVYSIHSILYSIPYSIHFTIHFILLFHSFSLLASFLFSFICLYSSSFTNSPFHSLWKWVYHYHKGMWVSKILWKSDDCDTRNNFSRSECSSSSEQTNFITNNPYMLVVTDQV